MTMSMSDSLPIHHAGYQRLVSAFMRMSPRLTRKAVFSVLNSRLRTPRVSDCLPVVADVHAPLVMPRKVMGIEFENALGVAAGFDRHGVLGSRLGHLGFGHLEMGTLTPEEMVNDLLPHRIPDSRFRIGINIAKQANHSLLAGIDDYLQGLQWAWSRGDYIVINLSGPAARDYLLPQNRNELKLLLEDIKERQVRLAEQTLKFCPVVIKLKTSSGLEDLWELLGMIKALSFDGVLAAEDVGKGASLGKNPTQQQILDRLAKLRLCLGEDIALISVGGLTTLEQASQRVISGASLTQMHNALVFRGPALYRELACATRPVY